MRHPETRTSAPRLLLTSLLLVLAAGLPPRAEAQGAWTVAPARQPTPRSEAPAALLGGLLYVPGGFGPGGCCQSVRAFEAYDPARGTWSARADLPAAVEHHVMVPFGDRLYVFWRQSTWVYDPARDSWSGPLPGAGTGLYAGGAVVMGRHVYMGGGATLFRRFDPEAGTWETLPSLRMFRDHLAMVVFEGRIWVMGGRSQGEMNAYRSVDIYDTAARTWTAGPEMRDIRSGFAAQVIDGRIYVAGGEVGRADAGATPGFIVGTAERYDPVRKAWEYVAPPPQPIHGVANAVHDGRLYLLGGSDKAHDAVVSGKVLVYDPPRDAAALAPRSPGRATPPLLPAGRHLFPDPRFLLLPAPHDAAGRLIPWRSP